MPSNEPMMANEVAEKAMGVSPTLTFIVDDGRGQLGRCGRCHRQVVWLVSSKTKKRQPCDPALYTISRGDKKIAKGRVSHFATCPAGKRSRRSGTRPPSKDKTA